MTEEQQAYLVKSQRALKTARLSLSHGDPAAAIDRASYAAFDLAIAALLTLGERPKTHSGTHNRFHLHFVHSGKIDRPTGAILKHAFDLRQRATYEAFALPDEAAASDLIADVERFVETVETMLQEPRPGTDSSASLA